MNEISWYKVSILSEFWTWNQAHDIIEDKITLYAWELINYAISVDYNDGLWAYLKNDFIYQVLNHTLLIIPSAARGNLTLLTANSVWTDKAIAIIELDQKSTLICQQQFKL